MYKGVASRKLDEGAAGYAIEIYGGYSIIGPDEEKLDEYGALPYTLTLGKPTETQRANCEKVEGSDACLSLLDLLDLFESLKQDDKEKEPVAPTEEKGSDMKLRGWIIASLIFLIVLTTVIMLCYCYKIQKNKAKETKQKNQTNK